MKTNSTTLTAERISKSATIILNDTIDNVFPLFGPVREMDWEHGWSPEIVYSTDKLVEEHMIFRSKGRFEGEDYYNWIVTQYRPQENFIEYTVSSEDRIWFISVQCAPFGAQTQATITYTFTSLNSRGAELNQLALDQMYSRNLRDWEEALNYYIKTGAALGSEQAKTN